MLPHRALAAEIREQMVSLSSLIEATNTVTYKSGRTEPLSEATCFCCPGVGYGVIACGPAPHDSDDYDYHEERIVCAAHYNFERISCEASGFKRSRCRVRRRERLTRDEVGLIDIASEPMTRESLIRSSGEFGPLLQLFSAFTEAKSQFLLERSALDEMFSLHTLLNKLGVVAVNEPKLSFDIAPRAESTSSKSVVCDIAPSAELLPTSDEPVARMKKNRRARGGKRTRAKQPGYCYLKFVRHSDRDAVMAFLGKYPTIGSVDDIFRDFDTVPRGPKAIVFVPGGAHVVHRSNWNIRRQWSILTRLDRARQIGAEIFPDHCPLTRDEFNYRFRDGPSYEELSVGDYADDHIRTARAYIDLVVERGLPRLLPEPEIEFSFPEMHPDITVGGTGDCWRKFLSVSKHIPIERDDVTVGELIPILEAFIDQKNADIQDPKKKFKRGINQMLRDVCYKLEFQEDGDLHVVKCIQPTPKQTKDYVAQGWMTTTMVLHFFKTGEYEGQAITTKFVGKAAVAPVDEAIRKIVSPEIKGAAERLLQPMLAQGVELTAAMCPWRIPVANQHMAESLCIPFSNMSSETHPHPIHAHIRRWSYLQVAKLIVADCTCIGMKPANFRMLQEAVARERGDAVTLTLVNAIVDIKDIGRYANTDTLTEEVWHLPKIQTPFLYCDESGHYLSPAWMLKIREENPDLRGIITTNIFPLVSLEFSISPNPNLYDYRIERTKGKKPILIYIPEGHVGGKYEQPYDPTMTLLREVTDERGNVIWRGGVMDCKLNTRVQMWVAYHIEAPRYVTIAEYDYVQLPRLFRAQPETIIVRADQLDKMIEYAMVLQSTEPKNQWGKLRLFVKDEKMYFPLSTKRWIVNIVMHMAKAHAECNLQSKLYNSLAEELYYKTVGHIVRKVHQVTLVRYHKRNARIMDTADPVTNLPTISVSVKSMSDTGGYGLSWKFDELPKPKFWQKFKNWISVMGYRTKWSDLDLEYSTDDEGFVKFPFIPNGRYYQNAIGLNVIQAMQAHDFLTHIERKEHKQPTFIEKNVSDLTALRTGFVEVRELPGEDIPLPAPEIAPSYHTADPFRDPSETLSIAESSYTSSSSGSSSGSSSSSSGSSTVTDTTITASSTTDQISDMVVNGAGEIWSDRNHCGECPSLFTYARQGGLPVMRLYLEYCEAWHAAQQIADPYARYNMETLMRQMTSSRVRPSGLSSVPEEVEENENVEERKLDSPEITELRDAAYQEVSRRVHTTYLRLQPERDPDVNEDAQGNPVETDQTERNAQEDAEHAQAVEEWEKYLTQGKIEMGSFLKLGSFLLWDSLFPMTRDKRLAKIPFNNVAIYPRIRYPEQDCLLAAMSKALCRSRAEILFKATRAYPREALFISQEYSPLKCLHSIALSYGIMIELIDGEGNLHSRYGVRDARMFVQLIYDNDHLSLGKVKSTLLIKMPRDFKYGLPQHLKLHKEFLKWPNYHPEIFVPEKTTAEIFIKDMMALGVGLIGQNPLNTERLKGWLASVDMYTSKVQKTMAVVVGSPGCRKSSKIQKIFKLPWTRHLGQWMMIAPTANIAQDWRDAVDATKKDSRGRALPGPMVMTFEKAMTEYQAADTVVFDEDKYPKGFIALFNILNQEVRHNIFCFDPMQASWHNPNADTLLNDPNILGEGDTYMRFCHEYLWGTWRFGGFLANFFRLPTFSKKEGHIAFLDHLPANPHDVHACFPWLSAEACVLMFESKQIYHSSHIKAVVGEALMTAEHTTLSGSIGRTVDLAIVPVDDGMLQGSDPALSYTAMTRSPYLIMVKQWRNVGRNEYLEHHHPVLGKLAHYRQKYQMGQKVVAERDYTVDMFKVGKQLPEGLPIKLAGPVEKMRNLEWMKQFNPDIETMEIVDPDLEIAGARLRYDNPIYDDNPTFKAYIDETPLIKEPKIELEEYIIPDRDPQTHIPVASREAFIEGRSDYPERFDRELTWGGEYSTQFPDTPQLRKDHIEQMSKVAASLKLTRRDKWAKMSKWMANPGEKDNPLFYSTELSNFGANQLSQDKVSFKRAVEQRIKYVQEHDNVVMLDNQRPFGEACWNAFAKYLGLQETIQFDQALFEDCILEFQERRAERPEALQKSSLNRAEPDAGQILTAKTQWKLKERDHAKAKPLQPVMIHPDEYLFKQGPRGMYMLKQMLKYFPNYWFFYAGKTPDDFSDWVAEHFVDGDMYHMGDQTGQDGNAQGWAVIVLEELMKYFDVPEEWLTDMKDAKMRLTLNQKILQIMTDSGEVWTFMVNTVSQAARECLMYGLQPGDPMASGGDDTLRRSGKSVTHLYHTLEWLDPCEDKREDNRTGSFCSFITRDGMLAKDPIILLTRFLGKLSRGEGADAAQGYFALWSMNFKLRDRLYELFDEDEMDAHQIMTRIMFNLKDEGIKINADWKSLSVSGDIDQHSYAERVTWLEEIPETVVEVVQAIPQQVADVWANFEL